VQKGPPSKRLSLSSPQSFRDCLECFYAGKIGGGRLEEKLMNTLMGGIEKGKILVGNRKGWVKK